MRPGSTANTAAWWDSLAGVVAKMDIEADVSAADEALHLVGPRDAAMWGKNDGRPADERFARAFP